MKVTTASLSERIAVLDQKLSAAHQRIDKTEEVIREQLIDISKDLKELSAWMNRGRGWAAAALLLSGAVGGLISALLKLR